MMLRQLLRYPFTRKLNKNNVIKRRAAVQNKEEEEQQLYTPFAINMATYNYLDELNSINLKEGQVTNHIAVKKPAFSINYPSSSASSTFSSLKQLYDKHDQTCLSLIRTQQENYIKNMSSSYQPSQKLQQFFQIKKRLSFKFRKYDQILIDIDNYLQILKHSDILEEGQLQGLYLSAYNKCAIVLMLSDHDRLHELLSSSSSSSTGKQEESLRKRRKMGEQKKSRGDALITFLKAQQQCRIMQSHQPNYTLYFESAYLQITSLLVLGLIKQSFTKVYSIIQLNISDNLREQLYLATLTALAFQSQSNTQLPLKTTITQSLRYKISHLQPLTQQQCSTMHLYFISAEIAEQIVDALSMKRYKKPIKQLEADELMKYARLVCLLCENYYLQGKLEEAERLITVLERIKEEEIWMLLNYIKMGILYDLNDYKSVLQIFQQILSHQTIDKEKPSPQFFNIKTINNDVLRVKIYKIAVKVYRQQEENQHQAQEMEDEMMALATTLAIHELKEPQLQDFELQVNWRRAIQVRIPYYYLQLKISQNFSVQENQFVEIQ